MNNMLKVGQLTFLTDDEKKKLFGNPKFLIEQIEKTKEKNLASNIYSSMANFSKIDLLDNHKTENKIMRDEDKSKYILDLDGSCLHYWLIFISLLTAYSCVTILYYVAFDNYATKKHLYWLDLTIDLQFLTDCILNFFIVYIDIDTSQPVKDHGKIAIHYLKTYFFFDFIAFLPIVYCIEVEYGSDTAQNYLYFKLLRFVRLPRFMSLFSQNHFDSAVERIFELKERFGYNEQSREQKVKIRFIARYIYQIWALVFIAILLTYILACIWWYFIRDEFGLNDDWENFNGSYGLNAMTDLEKLVVNSYFVLTTLTTVGYGDLGPVSNFEQGLGIVLMILGIGFFSYVIGNFNNVLTNYDSKMGIVNKRSELQDWTSSLTKFNNKALPKTLKDKIDKHFNFFWENDRLCGLSADDDYLQSMPNQLRMQLVNYLFEDVFKTFRPFFHKSRFEEEEFYYEIVFMQLPRKIEAGTVFLKKNDVSNNIYLVFDGDIAVELDDDNDEEPTKEDTSNLKKVTGYLLHKPETTNKEKLAFVYKKGYFFGEYSVLTKHPEGYKYRAKSNLCVYEIAGYKFYNLLNKYCEIKKVMKHEAYERKELLNNRFKMGWRDMNFKGEDYKDEEIQKKIAVGWLNLKAINPNQTEQKKKQKYDNVINKRSEEIKDKKNRFSRKKIEYYDERITNTLNHINSLDSEFKDNFSKQFNDIELISKKMAGIKNSQVKNNQAQI